MAQELHRVGAPGWRSSRRTCPAPTRVHATQPLGTHPPTSSIRSPPRGRLKFHRSGKSATVNDFVIDIEAIQKRARANFAEGPITDAYGADQARVVEVLNEALATELVCVLRYRAHYYRAAGLAAKSVAQEFAEHAAEEQGHADRIAARITQLQGHPDFDPRGLSERSHSDYDSGGSLVDMLKEDLVAERIAIEVYSEIVRWLGDADPTTRIMIQDILAVEEEHADDLLNLLGTQEPAHASLHT